MNFYTKPHSLNKRFSRVLGKPPDDIFSLEKEIDKIRKEEKQHDIDKIRKEEKQHDTDKIRKEEKQHDIDKIRNDFACCNIHDIKAAKKLLEQNIPVQINFSKEKTSAEDIIRFLTQMFSENHPTVIKTKHLFLQSSRIAKILLNAYILKIRKSINYKGYLKNTKLIVPLRPADDFSAQLQIVIDDDFEKKCINDKLFEQKFIQELSDDVFNMSSKSIKITSVKKGSIMVNLAIGIVSVLGGVIAGVLSGNPWIAIGAGIFLAGAGHVFFSRSSSPAQSPLTLNQNVPVNNSPLNTFSQPPLDENEDYLNQNVAVNNLSVVDASNIPTGQPFLEEKEHYLSQNTVPEDTINRNHSLVELSVASSIISPLVTEISSNINVLAGNSRFSSDINPDYVPLNQDDKVLLRELSGKLIKATVEEVHITRETSDYVFSDNITGERIVLSGNNSSIIYGELDNVDLDIDFSNGNINLHKPFPL